MLHYWKRVYLAFGVTSLLRCFVYEYLNFETAARMPLIGERIVVDSRLVVEIDLAACFRCVSSLSDFAE